MVFKAYMMSLLCKGEGRLSLQQITSSPVDVTGHPKMSTFVQVYKTYTFQQEFFFILFNVLTYL